jgi:hypothetical protein
VEHARFEHEEVQLMDCIENEQARWERERDERELSAQAKDQVAAAADGLRALVQRFDVPLFSREFGLSGSSIIYDDTLKADLEH